MKRSTCLAILGVVGFSCAAHAAVLSENFESGTLADNGWTSASGNWSISSDPVSVGNKYLANSAKSAGSTGQDISHALGTITGSWSVSFDYDWRWGGITATGSGTYGNAISVLMLDSNGDGYAVTVHQGTTDVAGNQNKLIEIYKVTDNIVATAALAGGSGYNRVGWKSNGSQSAPRFTTVEFTWDQDTGLLSVWYYSGGNLVLSTSVTDVSYSSFDQITVLAKGWNATESPLVDNIVVQTIPEATGLGLLSVGALALLRRR